MPHREFDALDADERGAAQFNDLIDSSPPRRLPYVRQMRRSSRSVPTSVRRSVSGKGRACDRRLELARGETEETIRHLSANYRANRIDAKRY